MEPYLILVYLLLTAAVVDLVVGVSNDAVNFLNSAIGSKAGSIRTILIIASLGVIAGSTFSSGMMEVARNGLFNPAYFTFDKVMIIFMAVMLTDIVLLDVYNSLGLPTSTTVSLVFEILGAAFITGVLVSFEKTNAFPIVGDVINMSSAITIVSGIFLSVLLAFFFGSLIQHAVRLLFSFKLDGSIRKYGAIFSGLCITTIIYFLLIKGAKGSILLSSDQTMWIADHTMNILIVSLAFWSIAVQTLMWWKQINPLKIVVLLGTFSLAMAFAANDLVNFIGVPVAALISFQAWAASGVAASDFSMEILKGQVSTPYWILLVSGGIMIITLWTNAKSRKVTETEVSLSRQDEGDERFKSNIVSRSIVGSFVLLGNVIDRIVPSHISAFFAKRFEKLSIKYKSDRDMPSFDLLRASVNLLVSSMLIAYGTSRKLPLSTTFVTFMVAMGTSFADLAWGRESAVYRVAGVINVISGWLVTAFMAFSSAAIMALIIYVSGFIGFFVVAAVAAFLIVRSHVVFRKKHEEEKVLGQMLTGEEIDVHQLIEESKTSTIKNLKSVRKITLHCLRSIRKGDRDTLVKSKKEIEKLREQNEKLHSKIIKYVRRVKKGHLAAGRLYILVFDLIQDLYQSANLVSEVCTNHIINHHPLPKNEYQRILEDVEKDLSEYMDSVMESIQQMNFKDAKALDHKREQLLNFIQDKLDKQILEIQRDELGNRMGLLQIRLLLEAKDILEGVRQIRALYEKFAQQ